MDDRRTVQALFDTAAPHYERDIAPWFGPMAADFVAFARPRPDDRALDVGTGTGITARALALHVRSVVGLDVSAAMLRAAPAVPRVHLVRGDLHHAPFPRGAFTLVTASFGLNTTRPTESLPALRRLIAPGGWLAIQEWGPAADLDRTLDDVLAGYAVETPGDALAGLRAWADDDALRWQNRLQDPDDYREWLAGDGFIVEDATESAPVAVQASPEDFLRFWYAWPHRVIELHAMPDAIRAVCVAAVRKRLVTFAGPDGTIRWQPVVLRALARREG